MHAAAPRIDPRVNGPRSGATNPPLDAGWWAPDPRWGWAVGQHEPSRDGRGRGAGGAGVVTTGVIVTGGASGIGRASAHALAAAGRPVALWDLDGAKAEYEATDVTARFG